MKNGPISVLRSTLYQIENKMVACYQADRHQYAAYRKESNSLLLTYRNHDYDEYMKELNVILGIFEKIEISTCVLDCLYKTPFDDDNGSLAQTIVMPKQYVSKLFDVDLSKVSEIENTENVQLGFLIPRGFDEHVVVHNPLLDEDLARERLVQWYGKAAYQTISRSENDDRLLVGYFSLQHAFSLYPRLKLLRERYSVKARKLFLNNLSVEFIAYATAAEAFKRRTPLTNVYQEDLLKYNSVRNIMGLYIDCLGKKKAIKYLNDKRMFFINRYGGPEEIVVDRLTRCLGLIMALALLENDQIDVMSIPVINGKYRGLDRTIDIVSLEFMDKICNFEKNLLSFVGD